MSGVGLTDGGEGIVLFASLAQGVVHLVLANHERPVTNVTITLSGAAVRTDGATVARVDDTHANAYTAWL